MHLIVDHVAEFQHVDDTHCCRLVETFTSTTIVQVGTAVTRKACLVGQLVDFLKRCTVEDWSSKVDTQLQASPTKHSFENLTQVHT